jgi:bacterioferritin-associated ferredoxin
MTGAPRRLPHAPAEHLTLTWNGRSVTGRMGDTVAATLYGAGHRVLTRSRKFHEPRGLSGSFAAGHLATVDGLPHRRLDRIASANGMIVSMQNAWPSPALDLMRLARLVPRRWLRAGFEHPRLLRDGTPLWAAWERALAQMAGMATVPRDGAGMVPGRRIEAGTLIVGGGPAARRAAAGAQGPVVLVTRSAEPGAGAASAGAVLEPLPREVEVLAGHDVYALYDGGRLAAAAPFDPAAAAVLIDARHVVLATGLRSVPPLVPGAALPGVLDAAIALELAHSHGVAPGHRTVVIGTHRRNDVARRLEALGCTIVDALDVAAVSSIEGHHGVTGLAAHGRRIACDAVVHAGPWRPDPALPFQAGANGELRLMAAHLPAHVRLAGACAQAPEAVSFGAGLDRSALVCPCMDVTVDEILDQVAAGCTHVEELKRRTACGMGTCQGVPCWDLLGALVADATHGTLEGVGHPTYRPPRAALTFGQAAGLADLTEMEP